MAAARGDTIALASAAHELKGAAGTIGAHKVAALCRDLELSLKDGERIGSAHLDALAGELGRARIALLELTPTMS